jgi:hypothetical protein
MSNNDKALREHLVTELLQSDHAHVDFDAAVKDFPPALRGVRPKGFPHSPWEILEHLRLAQWDILEFSRDAKHVSPDWPSGYWPETPAPPSTAAWEESVAKFRADLETLARLAGDPSVDLYAKIPHGTGQTMLRQILMTADHNAYHLGQLMLLRRGLEGAE